MAVSAASASATNSATASAVAGLHTSHSKSHKGDSDFSDALNAILSAQTLPQQNAATQDNTPDKKKKTDPSLTAASVQDKKAKATLDKAMNALRSNPAGDTSDDDTDATDAAVQSATAAQTAAPQTAATHQTADSSQAAPAHTGHAGRHTHKKEATAHAALTAATQAKLVAALAKAANAPAQIAGSDGKTAASSDSQGTPAAKDAQPAATTPAQSETSTQVASVLSAMLAAQPVVTTVTPAVGSTDAKAKIDVTARTMPQLEKDALNNTAQHATHAAAPAAKVEAQTLAVPLDAKAAKADPNSGSQSGTSDGQTKDQSGSAAATDAAKSAKTADAQPQAPDPSQPAGTAPVTSANAASTSAATNVAAAGNTTQTTPAAPVAVATALQVAHQTDAQTLAQQQPDIAALAISIASRSKDGEKQFDIRMEPAELGRVDVRLSVDAAGKTQAHLTADKPQTLQLLQNDRTTLERSLKDAGIDLSNSGLNFSLRGQQQNSTPTFTARNRALSISAVQTADIATPLSSTSTAPGDSRLDIRV